MSHVVGKVNRVQSSFRETLILEMVVYFLRTVGNYGLQWDQVRWGVPYSFLHLHDSPCPTCSSGLGNLLSEEPWPLSPTCYLSPSWVRTTGASCLTKSVTKALAPVAISGFRGSTCEGIGDLASLAAVSTHWETQPREQGRCCAAHLDRKQKRART